MKRKRIGYYRRLCLTVCEKCKHVMMKSPSDLFIRCRGKSFKHCFKTQMILTLRGENPCDNCGISFWKGEGACSNLREIRNKMEEENERKCRNKSH